MMTAGAFLLYLATLAPTVMWGDDAELQRLSSTTGATSVLHNMRDYPLWTAIAHAFTALPIGDVAWRANLVSAVFAALTIGGLVVASRRIGLSRVGALISGITLAVSHTFWMEAVRAEVYSLFLFLFVLVLLCLVEWRVSGSRWALGAASLLTGVAMLSHLMIVTAVPAILWLVIAAPPRGRRIRPLRIMLLAGLAGVLPYCLRTSPVDWTMNAAAGVEGLLNIRPRDFAVWIAFLAYQFILLAPLGLWGLIRFWKTDRVMAVFLVLLFAGDAVLGMSWHVPEQFVFFLPSYSVFALWIGRGASDLGCRLARFRASALVAGLLACALLPIPTYRFLPIVLKRLALEPLPARTLPYRDNARFFLYPPKNGYFGARRFGEEVLACMPRHASLLADWTPRQTLTYLQVIEGLRPDVRIAEFAPGRGEQVAWLLERAAVGRVFIADNESYYDLADIERVFDITPYGLVFELIRKDGDGRGARE